MFSGWIISFSNFIAESEGEKSARNISAFWKDLHGMRFIISSEILCSNQIKTICFIHLLRSKIEKLRKMETFSAAIVLKLLRHGLHRKTTVWKIMVCSTLTFSTVEKYFNMWLNYQKHSNEAAAFRKPADDKGDRQWCQWNLIIFALISSN